MPLAPADLAVPSSSALRAADNLARNAAALGASFAMPAMTFRLARDGSLTGYDSGWLAGCSVPRRAAEVMLQKTEITGNVACLVLPNHAGQIVACLAKVGRHVATIALLASADELPAMLACHDFSDDLASQRLMFAWDDSTLRRVFTDRSGLPIPQQFVRLATSSSESAGVAMKMAQDVFAGVVAAHSQRVRAARTISSHSSSTCVIGRQRFKLWDDAAATLATTLGDGIVDIGEPNQSAAAFVAERMAQSRVVVAADIGRADRPELAEIARPWLCWVTQNRVPAYVPSAPRDGLLIADASLATLASAAGWPTARVRVAGFPFDPLPGGGAGTAIICDLPPLAAPKSVCDFSSWRVAWDSIAAELLDDPLRLGADADAYLETFLRRHDIADKTLPRELFIQQLIAAAAAVGLARLLHQRGAVPAIYGDGWADYTGELDVRGAIDNRVALRHALTRASNVVDCFIGRAAHPIHFIDRPTLRPFGMTLPSLIGRLNSPPTRTADAIQPISRAAIEPLL